MQLALEMRFADRGVKMEMFMWMVKGKLNVDDGKYAK